MVLMNGGGNGREVRRSYNYLIALGRFACGPNLEKGYVREEHTLKKTRY